MWHVVLIWRRHFLLAVRRAERQEGAKCGATFYAPVRKLQFCLFSVGCKRYTLTYRSLAQGGGSPHGRESTLPLQTKGPASLAAKSLLVYYRLTWFAATCVQVRRSGVVDSLTAKRGPPSANRGLNALLSGPRSSHRGCKTVLGFTCGRFSQAAGLATSLHNRLPAQLCADLAC